MRSLNDLHVLARATLNGLCESYWTGKTTKSGRAAVTQHLDCAATFRNPYEAYRAGGKVPALNQFRAIRPGIHRHADGFKSRWWIK